MRQTIYVVMDYARRPIAAFTDASGMLAWVARHGDERDMAWFEVARMPADPDGWDEPEVVDVERQEDGTWAVTGYDPARPATPRDERGGDG